MKFGAFSLSNAREEPHDPESAHIFGRSSTEIGGPTQRGLHRFGSDASPTGGQAREEGRHRRGRPDVGVRGVGREGQDARHIDLHALEFQGFGEGRREIGEFIHGRDLPTHRRP